MIASPVKGALFQQLNWLIQAPPLLQCVPFEDAGSLLKREWLRHPGLIANAVEWLEDLNPPRRLGLAFEQWVAALVSVSEGLELVERNLPVRDQNTTLGELDMLVRDRDSGKLWHWELALKFYLGTTDHWYGPNSRDTLARKHQHLFEQQLPRSTLPECRSLLANRGLRVDGRALLTRGRLFYRNGHPDTPPRHPRHERGWWLPSHSLPQQQWRMIDKKNWPLPSMSDKSTTSVDTLELIDYVESQSRPVMVCSALRPEPGFIVPVSWPRA
ncbi:DUF1853 family protein [Alcanivorax sp. S6407]|uniref:DUF1853 family protein n=1 Tax=Alcanivorax sp. S6407 TaxID=2926424 RepID=UPI001FF33568|nr:DUF1853 family protein [Alcanivorax sp. S6407]MCK0152992.1 DUF1853 family protein [Alcanivorax sp. S6407]